MRCRSIALIPLAVWLLGGPAAPGGANAEGELLTPGPPLERSIASGENHIYRVEVTDAPLLVTVEQRGVDLVVEAQRSGEPSVLTDAPLGRWGLEVLLLSTAAAGEYRIEVHPRTPGVPPGRYAIQVEVLSLGVPGEGQRTAALRAMSRGGQLAAGTPESRPQALAAYREALAGWRSLGERRWEAECLQAVAVLQKQTGDLKSAVETYEEDLPIWRSLAATEREASVLRALGTNRMLQGELEPARQALERSVALWQRAGERFDEAVARSELCGLEHRKGALSQALVCYEQTRTLFHEVGDTSQESRMLTNLGGVYDLLGEPDAALDHYEQALALQRALGDRSGEANTLNNIGMIHQVLGEWQEALRLYAQAREFLPSLDNPRWLEATLLNNVGFAYLTLGEPQRALTLLDDALKLRRQIGVQREELITLNNLGNSWHRLGDLKRALDHHRRALQLATVLNDPLQESLTRLSLADVQLDQGNSAAALHEIEPALAFLRDNGLRRAEQQALQLQARAFVLAGRPQEALLVMQGVLARRRDLRDRAGEAETLRALATAERSLGSLAEARAHAEAAVARVEELRTGFVRPDLRAAFLASRRNAYSLLIQLLMERHTADPGGGHDREALAINEQARARSLLDALYAGRTGRPGSGVPAELVTRWQSLQRRLSAKADQQLQQRTRAEALEREIQLLLTELDGVEAEIRHHDPQYATFRQPQPIGVKEIVRLLDPGTLLLEYSLGEERSYLWAIGPGGLRSFDLPPQREIEDLARKAYEEMNTVESGAGRRPQTMEALSRILLRPVWHEAASVQRLAVVPDGALHLLPFAALPVPAPGQRWDRPSGWQPLLESQEVVYLPSATTLAVQRQRLERRAPALKWAAILADPVFSPDDPRLAGPPVASRRSRTSVKTVVARGGRNGGLLPVFERLPSSQEEAKAIAGFAPAGQVRTALALDATRQSVLAGDYRDYRVIHFATHGVADTRNPELSGLVLSLVDAAGQPREGFLGLSDIYGLDLNADLVVLSGCRTALGKEVRGEGLMGITRGFLYAGVPRVVASLWKVEDRTTAELMTRFYRAMWSQGLSPAAALREAQRSLRRVPRYRASYSWAGFVLQGDWRGEHPQPKPIS
jgi:CHAT domain-containing protein/tetratricopeptide (TPR) repeat protein